MPVWLFCNGYEQDACCYGHEHACEVRQLGQALEGLPVLAQVNWYAKEEVRCVGEGDIFKRSLGEVESWETPRPPFEARRPINPDPNSLWSNLPIGTFMDLALCMLSPKHAAWRGGVLVSC